MVANARLVPAAVQPPCGPPAVTDASPWRRAEARLALAVLLLAAATLTPAPPVGYEARVLALAWGLAHGRTWIDPDKDATVDRAWVPARGHHYTGGAPGLSVAVLPVAAATEPPLVDGAGRAALPARAGWLVVLAGAALPLAAFAVAARRAVRRATGCDEEAATAAAALAALGTFLLGLGGRLYPHALAAALLAGGLALGLRRREGEPGDEVPVSGRAWLAAGLCAGLAVACDYGVAPCALAVVALAALRGGARAAGAVVLGGLGPALLLGLYHQVCFGAPWRTAYDFHEEAGIRELMGTAAGYRLPRPSLVVALLAGPERGLLWTGPAALLGAVGLGVALRDARRAGDGARVRTLALAAGTATVVLLLNAARVHDWHAGTTWGPRYLTGALPFVALGLPAGLALLGRARAAVVAACVAVAAVGAVAGTWGPPRHLVELLAIRGPHAAGAAALVLGDARPSFAAALLSCAALTAAAPLAVWLVRPTARPRWLVAAALGPLVVGGLGLQGWTGGVAEVRGRERAAVERQVRREIEACDDPLQARRLAVVAGRLGPRVELDALERLTALDPGDASARARRDQLRRMLPR